MAQEPTGTHNHQRPSVLCVDLVLEGTKIIDVFLVYGTGEERIDQYSLAENGLKCGARVSGEQDEASGVDVRKGCGIQRFVKLIYEFNDLGSGARR